MECTRNHRSRHTAKALEILGVSQSLDQEQGTQQDAIKLQNTKEIEKAYRKLARKHHPDRGGDEQNFIELKAARDFLVTGGASAGDLRRTAAPFGWDSHAVGGGTDCPSRVLVRGRSCVRDLTAKYDSKTSGMTVLAATDRGLKIVHEQRDDPSGTTAPSCESLLTSEAILCCALSSDRRFAFAGTGKGQVHRYFLSDKVRHPTDDTDTMYSNRTENAAVELKPLENLIGYPAKRKAGIYGMFDATTRNASIVSVVVRDPLGDIPEKNQQLVFAGCDSPPAVAVLQFRNASVDTLWSISNANGLDRWISTVDSLSVVTSCSRSNLNCLEDDDGGPVFHCWCGGSNSTSEAVLVDFVFDPTELQTSASETKDGDDEEDWWLDSYDDDSDCTSDRECNEETCVPAVACNLGFGSVYSIDHCPPLGLQAVTVGSDVILLETRADVNDNTAGPAVSLRRKKTLATDHTLYCVRISSNDMEVAACGAGESITIWSLVTGTISRIIHLNVPKDCNLSTNCIMALDWLLSEKEDHGENEGECFRRSIVSGGYDGNVTQWYIDANTTHDDTDHYPRRYGLSREI